MPEQIRKASSPRDEAISLSTQLHSATGGRYQPEEAIAVAQVFALVHIGDAIDRLARVVQEGGRRA
jgi:hypothetical protein